jgi:hypothetical protein
MRLSKRITPKNRLEIIQAVMSCPDGSMIELITDQRTLAQNRLMQWLLADIAEQATLGGEKHGSEAWKCAFLKAMGQRMEFIPSLDGEGIVALGYSSSKLSKSEMADLITMIYQYGDSHGVTFRIDERKQGDAA